MRNLIAYIPMDRRHALTQGIELPERCMGTALFADISGFTPLFAALAEQLGPQRAAEEMTRMLGQVYDSLVYQVAQQHGSVIDFVGDAITCWFDEKGEVGREKGKGRRGKCEGQQEFPIEAAFHPSPFPLPPSSRRAATCALAMQRTMVPFADVEVLPGVQAALAVKVGIAYGPARRFVVGNPALRQIDVLTGATLRAMSQAEELAQKGEIVLAPSARAVLQGNATLAETRVHPEEGTEFAVLTALTAPADAVPWPTVDAADVDVAQLRPWILASLYPRLRGGDGEAHPELRPIVAIFVRFTGIDYDYDLAAGQKLDAFIRWVQQTAARYAGEMIQVTIGDKGSFLYIVFGAIAAHDDDAFRAVRTAEALLVLPESFRFLALQIGIASGPARTGAYGSATRRSYGAIGSDVVLAARLMTAAPPGEMRCSYSVYRQVQSKVSFETLPPVRVKGRAGLIRVYRPAREAVYRTIAPPPTLVGRRAEAAVLAHVLDKVQDGEARVLLIEGEAGIGKSHLVEVLKYLAREYGLSGLTGNGQSIEQQTPYRAWRDVFNSYFGLDDVPQARERRTRVATLVPQLVPEHTARLPVLNDILGLDLPETPLTQSLDANLRQQNVTLVVTALLRAWTDERPLVLILDDVHWLDALSWQLVLQVTRTLSLHNAPFLLVLVHRPLEERSAGHSVLTELRAMPITREVTLTSLTPEDIHALIAHRLRIPVAALPAPLRDLVATRANGNPFFAEELVFNLRDTGVIQVEGGSGDAPGTCCIRGDLEDAQHTLPDTLHGLILARLDRQPSEQQFILKVAAVLGRSFAYAPLFYTLNHYITILAPALKDHLTALQAADFTFLETLEPELTYRFKHIITQEAAYQTLLFAQRRDLHRTAAAWYEAQPEAQTFWPLLAHHYHYAEDTEKEIHYLKLAGEAAEQVYANEAALEFYTRLLTLLDTAAETEDVARTPDPSAITEEQAKILIKRGRILELIGRWDEAEADYRTVLSLSESGADLEWMARCQNHLGDLYRQRGDYPEALEWFRRAQSSWETLHHPAGRAHALMGQGVIARTQGDYATARERLAVSQRLAQESHDHQGLAEAYKHLAWLDTLEGNLDQAQAGYKEALALARALDNRVLIANGLNNLASALDMQSDLTAIQSLIEEALAIRQEIGDKAGVANSLHNLGAVFFAYSDWATARKYFEKSVLLMREMGDKEGVAYVLLSLAYALIHQGDYAQTEDRLQEAAVLLQAVGCKQRMGYMLRMKGMVRFLQGDAIGARAHFEASIDMYRQVGSPSNVVYSTCHLALTLIMQGEWRAGRALYQENLPHVRELDTATLLVHILVGLTTIVLHLGLEAAAARLAAIVETWRAANTTPLDRSVLHLHERTLAQTRAALSPADFEAAWAQGVQVPVDQAIDEALRLTEKLS